ncbi:hypothetical protein H112_04232 [Trichophyton rubrum D6]|uniref:Uncharacterized protein n=4 Tax=Trichophyton TaxID=5550 RepID=F2SPL3_TRIRC|nr:uncharacterized protein TERG_04011 [Trichophyton rubrum CBS 118892]EZF22718.1 hypothetical protein H100_04238 [Trichophyton rubrum MR850]EZF41972.1 hypothetical protein H102_04225 [Trichophyton rubrum CBS 100081]EZF52677.1 hypothetical protein H103_04233 [Trichophyton rubrum CBS 288.86]EZF63177.1 hypothetical protein H104_04222 [Trichophyton rubrum CBS 289.86]EZF73911.1 hypothetical protein H105_04250 [Trichophyton soudanense CBS 452.61]EZF84607.1 hypothetical protein H110_04227 [Trichophy
MACPITVAKFVGMISIGISTGLSYSMSSITLPALQGLPTASVASQALTDIQFRARRAALTLSHITVFTLITAFSLSSPRRRHPYLLWTSAFALLGGLGLELYTNHPSFIQGTESPRTSTCSSYLSSLCSVSTSSEPHSPCCCAGSILNRFFGSAPKPASPEKKAEDEESLATSSEIELVEPPSEAESMGTSRSTEKPTPASSVADVNGESVELAMKKERNLHMLRTYLFGVGFSMGVIGIWGERTS